MIDLDAGGATVLLAKEANGGYAFRAARACNVRGFHPAHRPETRNDFLQALQLLGAEPEVARLSKGHRRRLAQPVHVSCAWSIWSEVFGEPECVEQYESLQLWKHFCSDGPVTCVGHLLCQEASADRRVVLRRIMFV